VGRKRQVWFIPLADQMLGCGRGLKADYTVITPFVNSTVITCRSVVTDYTGHCQIMLPVSEVFLKACALIILAQIIQLRPVIRMQAYASN